MAWPDGIKVIEQYILDGLCSDSSNKKSILFLVKTIAFLEEYYTFFLVILTQSISFEWNFYIPTGVKKTSRHFYIL